ncbi:MAG TPA: hypothetical protein VGZ02_10060 [Candidatus Baltobacteraceae bacterium]|jgi:hypothetical protein|nr:hypothetical protein [Candidatus Baltobacteraceae bacterium]
MQKTATALLAVLAGIGLMSTPAGAQQYNGYPYTTNPQPRYGYQNSCYQNRRTYRRHDRDDRNGDNDRDDRDRGDRDNNGNGNGYGYGNGNGNGRWRNNGNNNNYNGNYGNNCASYGRQNSVVRGAIVGVNGNMVTLQTQNFSTVTIDDQPALDNRATGRVAIGRIVTAYGYWQNGTFYATQLV